MTLCWIEQQNGQITMRTGSLEEHQIAVLGVLPIVVTIFRSHCARSGLKTSMYLELISIT